MKRIVCFIFVTATVFYLVKANVCVIEKQTYRFISIPEPIEELSINIHLDSLPETDVKIFIGGDGHLTNLIEILFKRIRIGVYQINTVEMENSPQTFEATAIIITYKHGKIKIEDTSGLQSVQFLNTYAFNYFWYNSQMKNVSCKLEEYGQICTGLPLDVQCFEDGCLWQPGKSEFGVCEGYCSSYIPVDCHFYQNLYPPSTNQSIINDNHLTTDDGITSVTSHTYTDVVTDPVITEKLTEFLTEEVRLYDEDSTANIGLDNEREANNYQTLTADRRTTLLELSTTGNVEDMMSEINGNNDIQNHGERTTTSYTRKTESRTSLQPATSTQSYEDDSGYSFSAGLYVLISLTGALVIFFFIGCICAIDGLLMKPRKRRKVLPEEEKS